MAKANWHRASFNTNARNKAARDGDRQEVVFREVDDPVETTKKAIAAVSIRCSSIDFMYQHDRISDAQKGAADRFHGLWQAANSNELQGMDYGKVRVDGTRHGSGGMIDRRIEARDQLARIRAALGDRAFIVLSVAAGLEGGLQAVADAIGRSKATASLSVKAALEALSRHWGAEGAGYGIRAE